MVLRELFALYREHQLSYNRPASVAAFDHSTNQLRRLIGNPEVADLTSKQVQEFVSARREECKPVSVNKDLRYLKGALRWGVEMGYLDLVPCKIRMLRCPKKRDLKVLTKAQIEKLIASAPGEYKLLIHLGAVTGMRLGEILSLRWEHIIPEEERLVVRGETAKSHQHRSIPLSETTLLLLREHRKRSRFPADENLIFSTRNGTPKNRNNVSNSLKRIWEEAGLYQRGVPTTHHLRHSAASRMLSNGASIETVREILGHADCATTALYLHSDDEQKRQSVAALKL